jgi:hypothetical protein
MPVQYLQKYQKTLKQCKQCGETFKPGGSQLFCGHSCAASFSNAERVKNGYVVTEEHKQRTAKSVIKSLISKGHTPKKVRTNVIHRKIKPVIIYSKPVIVPVHETTKNASGPFSYIYTCSCKHCGIKFTSRIKKQYCDVHRTLYSNSSKAGYKFTFNVYYYPELFDIDLLNKVGWFSPGGTAGTWNINGLSRDHKVSVTESIKNNYDPFYITHPLNCQLMTHSENNKKKTQSSMSYNDLITLVDNYENKLADRREIESRSFSVNSGTPNTLSAYGQ